MTHILIINQHGENRGDEAAMRAMLASFTEAIPGVTFTLLYQFRDRSLRLKFKEPVDDLPIVLPPTSYLRGGLYTLLKAVGIDARWVLPEMLRRTVAAYDRANLVVSAPGGPYFGDIYVGHEIVHWWYVLLAVLFKKSLFLYAPSAGPFKNRLMNPIRRWLYPKFSVLVSREEISARYIEALLGGRCRVEVTADSAIQSSFRPYSRQDWFAGDRAALRDRLLVAVSLNDYRYPGSHDPQAMKDAYNAAMIEVLNDLAARNHAHLLFLPQLYGRVHNDAPYLEAMGKRLRTDTSWEVVDPSLDSDMQRRLFAMCDLHIASRYHPAIFGHIACVPGICIYYEHKALGFMQQLGLERFAFDIRSLRAAEMLATLSDLLQQRAALIDHLRGRVPTLQERAARTTRLAVQVLSRTAA
jgi:colanic acid/amylovoran biosynthesis protein